MIIESDVTTRLKADEGFVPHCYLDSLKFQTIGFGRLIDERRGGGITRQEAEYLLRNDIYKRAAECESRFEWWDALVMVGLPLKGFAQAADIERVRDEVGDVKRQVAALEASVSIAQRRAQRSSLESEVRRLDQEIFGIEARVQELSQANLRPDRIYAERFNDLRIQKDRVQSRLQAFLRANPDIAGDL